MSVIAFPVTVPPPYGTQCDQPLRVLGADLSQRIARVNTVLSLLGQAGYRVEYQDLIRHKRPLLRIEAGDQRLRGVAECIRRDGDHVTALINGVDVQWPHAAVATLPTRSN